MRTRSRAIGWYRTKAQGVIGFDEQNDTFTLTGKLWEKAEGPPGTKFDRKPSKTETTIYIRGIERSLLHSLLGKNVVFTEKAKRDGDYLEHTTSIRTVR